MIDTNKIIGEFFVDGVLFGNIKSISIDVQNCQKGFEAMAVSLNIASKSIHGFVSAFVSEDFKKAMKELERKTILRNRSKKARRKARGKK